MTRDELRAEFPALETPGPIWLDSAATSLKLRSVIESLTEHYRGYPATAWRSQHQAGERATLALEAGRRTIAAYLGTEDPSEVIFVPSATAGINLFTRSFWGGRIIGSLLEHNSNLLPWRALARRTASALELVGLDQGGGIDLEDLDGACQRPATCLALTLRSNVTGARLDLPLVSDLARRAGAILFVDATQEAARGPLDLKNQGVDAAVFSAHKMHGPEGIGVLWVRREVLERLEPSELGGGMVRSLGLEREEFHQGARGFEAGTHYLAGVKGLAEAANWLTRIGRERLVEHEDRLGGLVYRELQAIKGLSFYSRPGGIISFTLAGWHPHDLVTELDQAGFALRAGSLCANLCLANLGVKALVRASLAIHTSEAEVQAFLDQLKKIAGGAF